MNYIEQKKKAIQLNKEWEQLGQTSIIMKYRMKGAKTAIKCLQLLGDTNQTKTQQKEIAKKMIWICGYLFMKAISHKDQQKAIYINRFKDGINWTIADMEIYTTEEIWKIESQGNNAYADNTSNEWKQDPIAQEILKQLKNNSSYPLQ